MNQYEQTVSEHYASSSLLAAIRSGLAQIEKSAETVTINDLTPVSEFHIGGRAATTHLLDQVDMTAGSHILDIGCGVGGPARYIADHYNSRVTGIDLTPEFVDVGNTMCRWVGLSEQVTLQHGSALAMPFENAAFDGATMLHVGMNIADKAQLFAEIYRTLRPGAWLAIYDIMRISDDDLAYPVPWATDSSTSHLATPEQYQAAIQQAGFTNITTNSRRDFAITAFNKIRASRAANSEPAPLGRHLIMGSATLRKLKNMFTGVINDVIIPVEIIAYVP